MYISQGGNQDFRRRDGVHIYIYLTGVTSGFQKEGSVYLTGVESGFQKEGSVYLTGVESGFQKEGFVYLTGVESGFQKEGWVPHISQCWNQDFTKRDGVCIGLCVKLNNCTMFFPLDRDCRTMSVMGQILGPYA